MKRIETLHDNKYNTNKALSFNSARCLDNTSILNRKYTSHELLPIAVQILFTLTLYVGIIVRYIIHILQYWYKKKRDDIESSLQLLVLFGCTDIYNRLWYLSKVCAPIYVVYILQQK